MLRLCALLAAGLTAPAAVASTLPAPGGSIEVEAGTIVYDAAADRYRLEGGVRLVRGNTALRARTVSYDPRTGTVEAAGEVLLAGPGRVVAAAGARVVLDGPWEASEVVAFLKDGPLDLRSAESVEAARRRGRNRLSLRAERLSGEGERLVAEGAKLTPCDCGEGSPSWEISASRADVIPGERALLTWPVLRVTPRILLMDKPVPVLPLPWLYLPLAERRTGLLLPAVQYGSRTGWALSLPFFLALSRSADATVTADHVFGPPGGPPAGQRGLRGPGATVELRWAPAEGTSGRVEVEWLHDLRRDPGDPPGGDRLGVFLGHGGPLSERTALGARLRLVSDAAWLDDFGRDLLGRTEPFLRSAAGLSHFGDDLLLAAELGYYLGIGSLSDPAAAPVPFGLFGWRLPGFHRLPAGGAMLLPVRLAGPVRLSGALSAARFAPLSGITNQADASGLGPGERGWAGTLPLPPGSSWAPGQRLAASRLAAEAELRAPLALGRALEVEPWARGRALGYTFASGASPALLDAWGTGGVTVSTRLSRTFGEGTGRLRHDIEPRLEWRAGSGLAGPRLPAYGYDEIERVDAAGRPCVSPRPEVAAGPCLPLRSLSAGPPGGWSQLRLGLRNRLTVAAGPLSRSTVDLDLGQDLDLKRGALAETWARGAVQAGPVSGGLTARFRAFGAKPPPGSWSAARASWLDPFTELRADLSLASERGDRVHGSLLALGPGASGPLRAGSDPLFDGRPVPLAPSAQGSAGAVVKVASGLEVSYDALFNVRTVVAPGCNAARSPVEWAPHLQQQTASLGWNSPCRCWRAAVRVRVSECGDWGVGATLDLGEIAGLRFSP